MDKLKNMSQQRDRLEDSGQHESRKMRTGKSEFNFIEADSLTIEMQGTSGTRGNFNTVPALNVPCSVWFRASGQGRPKSLSFQALAYHEILFSSYMYRMEIESSYNPC